MASNPVVIPYNVFVAKYRPIATGIIEGEPSRPMFAAFGQDLQTVRRTDETRVWTVIDIDLSCGEPHPYEGEDGDNCWVIVAGFHYVNRLGYLITEVPWESADIEVLY